MDENAIQPFRFKDLPTDIRIKIYKLLLCTFTILEDHVEKDGDHFTHLLVSISLVFEQI